MGESSATGKPINTDGGYDEVRKTGRLVEYLLNGELHRIGGPALIRPDGTEEYWINGIRAEDV